MLTESEVALLVLLSSICVQQKSDAKLKHVIFDRPTCLLNPCEFILVAKFLEQALPPLYQTLICVSVGISMAGGLRWSQWQACSGHCGSMCW